MKPKARHQVRLQVELLEERLNPPWGSIPPASVPAPWGAPLVVLDAQGDAQGFADISAKEIDWVRFVAPTTGVYAFTVTTPTSNLDPVAALYNAYGGRVGFNDDITSSNWDSGFSSFCVQGWTYFLGVAGYQGKSKGAYTWRIDGPSPGTPPDDEFEENDTALTATPLGTLPGTWQHSNLIMADGHDLFRFTLEETSFLRVSIFFQHAYGDLDLQLWSGGRVVGVSEGVSDYEHIALTAAAPGTYYIRVFGYQGALNPNYQMVVAATAEEPPTSGFNIELRMTGLTPSQQAIFLQAARRWESIIVADIPDVVINGRRIDDLLIDASAITIDGQGNVLGRAGPTMVRAGSMLPFHGIMEFDIADLAWMQSQGLLFDVVLHEIGHILGIGTIWSYRGLIAGSWTNDPRFIGVQARAEYNAMFGVNAIGVPVEAGGGSGTRLSHWRESVFTNELMTGWVNAGFNPLSRITVASLADLGYTVDMSQADQFPLWAGLMANPTSYDPHSLPHLLPVLGRPAALAGLTSSNSQPRKPSLAAALAQTDRYFTTPPLAGPAKPWRRLY
ncbi:MAG TPA: leishmanolysin-related zinc metalloendopeptidase [Gemmatales bacterium]|nr:leishmanolysin-related zinc metalloendopeptidase [Gemmatales bacterium]